MEFRGWFLEYGRVNYVYGLRKGISEVSLEVFRRFRILIKFFLV